MKQISILLLMVLFLGSAAFAQEEAHVDNRTKEEKIQSLEIAFISRKLNLKPEEAQKFWPIYNEYKRDIRQAAQQHRAKPDRDVLELEEQIIDIRKSYRDRFSTAIGKERMNSFFKAEHEFRGVLLNRIKNQHGRQDNPGIRREKRVRN